MVSPGQQSMLVYPRSWDSGKITGKRGFFNGPYGGFRKKNNPKNRWPLPWGLQSALSFCRLPPLGGLRKAARRGLRTLLEGLGIMLYPCCLACFSWWLWLFTSDFWCLIHFVDSQTWLVYRYIYISYYIYIYPMLVDCITIRLELCRWKKPYSIKISHGKPHCFIESSLHGQLRGFEGRQTQVPSKKMKQHPLYVYIYFLKKGYT